VVDGQPTKRYENVDSFENVKFINTLRVIYPGIFHNNKKA